MQVIPGWLMGVIVLALVLALGWAAIIPSEINVIVTTENEENTEITNNYNNHAKPTDTQPVGPVNEQPERF